VTDDVQHGGRPYGAGAPPSQQRSWWPVHEFIEAVVRQANCGPIPAAGTPTWCGLSDGDPLKLFSLAVDGEHHVLRVETAQLARAAAAHDISLCTDWSAVACSIRRRRDAYISRRSA